MRARLRQTYVLREAWNSLGDMSQKDAKLEYVKRLVAKIKGVMGKADMADLMGKGRWEEIGPALEPKFALLGCSVQANGSGSPHSLNRYATVVCFLMMLTLSAASMRKNHRSHRIQAMKNSWMRQQTCALAPILKYPALNKPLRWKANYRKAH